MAKVTEGDPYYYAPCGYYKNNLYGVYKRREHPNLQCIALDVSQDNASLIVDALNLKHLVDNINWDKIDCQISSTCMLGDTLRAETKPTT